MAQRDQARDALLRDLEAARHAAERARWRRAGTARRPA